MSEQKLAGKVALITGGARGLGRGYALRLAGLGADIAVIDRNLNAADVYAFEREQMTAATVVEEIEALGARVMGLEVDLTDRSAAEKTVADIVDTLGRIDICVCNAGGGTVTFADELESQEGDRVDVNTTGTPANCPQDMLIRVIDSNLMTCMYTCMAVAPYMQRQQSGKIVTVSSTAGLDAGDGYHPYGTAKAAIVHYTRTLAQELGPYNINVNAIAPGIIRTGRLGDRSHQANRIPLRREGTIVWSTSTGMSHAPCDVVVVGNGRSWTGTYLCNGVLAKASQCDDEVSRLAYGPYCSMRSGCSGSGYVMP